MESHESPEHRHKHFRRIRRTKWLLQFAPRKARFHRYPFIGRFADVARKRSYLWSFRSEDVRTAIYVGAVLALLPVMGVQIPVAFLLALLLRKNVMVLTGLQMITNPFTAAFLYYATYRLGHAVTLWSGFGNSTEVIPTTGGETILAGDANMPAPPHTLVWSEHLGTTFNALVIGGVILGLALGLILDIAWRIVAARVARRRQRRLLRKRRSGSTTPDTAAS